MISKIFISQVPIIYYEVEIYDQEKCIHTTKFTRLDCVDAFIDGVLRTLSMMCQPVPEIIHVTK